MLLKVMLELSRGISSWFYDNIKLLSKIIIGSHNPFDHTTNHWMQYSVVRHDFCYIIILYEKCSSLYTFTTHNTNVSSWLNFKRFIYWLLR